MAVYDVVCSADLDFDPDEEKYGSQRNGNMPSPGPTKYRDDDPSTALLAVSSTRYNSLPIDVADHDAKYVP